MVRSQQAGTTSSNDVPDDPTDLSGGSWFAAAKRALKEYKADLAGIIIFLIWMWISNVAILLGAEFNAELERGRAVAGGHPLSKEPFSELRDDRKLRRKEKKERKRLVRN